MAQKIDLGGNDVIVNSLLVGASSPGQSGTDIGTTDLTALAGVTAGTVTASKVVIVDASKNASTFGSIGAANVNLSAGTASVAPITLASGTNLTTAAVGATEFDGKVFYDTAVASTRQVRRDEMFTYSNVVTTLVNNSTGAQNIFNTGSATLSLPAATTYMFEGFFNIGTGGTTHTTAFGLAPSSAFTDIHYWSELASVTSGTINTSAWSTLDVATANATVLNATSTATTTLIYVMGSFRTNLATTITPQITFSAGPTGTCQTNIGSWFRVYPIGTNAVTQVGNWA